MNPQELLQKLGVLSSIHISRIPFRDPRMPGYIIDFRAEVSHAGLSELLSKKRTFKKGGFWVTILFNPEIPYNTEVCYESTNRKNSDFVSVITDLPELWREFFDTLPQ